jgi:plasmid maintenance system antidote protein VapI
MAGKRQIPLTHPGEILSQEFLEPMGISQYRIAKDGVNLQSHYDLEQTRARLVKELERVVVPHTAQ